MNNQFFYNKDEVFFDGETLKKILILIVIGGIMGILLAIMFAGFLYGIQPKTPETRLSYGKLFIIIIAPCILLGLIAGILLL